MTPRHLLEPGRLAGSAMLRAQSDDRLVDLTRAGNDRAFEAIVDRYKGPLLRYCGRILSDGRGEDAVQQVFLKAYDALHRDAAPRCLRAWLFGIAHNVSLNILRQRGRAHEALEPQHATGESAAHAAERRQRLREVLAAVAALPPSQRDAMVLRELEGRGHEEIARELGVTGGAARQLISRARNSVRAAAAGVVPVPLLARLTDGSAPAPTASRVAELAAAGGGLTVAKVVTTVAIGGALVGGATKLPDVVKPHPPREQPALAADPPSAHHPVSGNATEGEARDGANRVGARRGDRNRDGRRGGPAGDGGRERGSDDEDPGEGRDERDRAESDDDERRSGSGGSGRDRREYEEERDDRDPYEHDPGEDEPDRDPPEHDPEPEFEEPEPSEPAEEIERTVAPSTGKSGKDGESVEHDPDEH